MNIGYRYRKGGRGNDDANWIVEGTNQSLIRVEKGVLRTHYTWSPGILGSRGICPLNLKYHFLMFYS